MSKPKFKENDRVSFMAWTAAPTDSNPFGMLKNFVGYVKQVRRRWWGKTRYAICVAKTSEMFIVDECDVIGLVEKKENKTKTED